MRCDEGYEPSGCHVIRYSRKEGKWNHNVPRCQKGEDMSESNIPPLKKLKQIQKQNKAKQTKTIKKKQKQKQTNKTKIETNNSKTIDVHYSITCIFISNKFSKTIIYYTIIGQTCIVLCCI